MKEPRIVNAEAKHVGPIAIGMRHADRREIWRSNRVAADRALVEGLKHSSHCWTALTEHGEPIAMFGAAPLSLLTGSGVPWMLGTNKLREYQKGFLSVSKVYIGEMLKDYNQLTNYVDAENAASIRWLNWIGFKLQEAEPYGQSGALFHRFTLSRGDFNVQSNTIYGWQYGAHSRTRTPASASPASASQLSGQGG